MTSPKVLFFDLETIVQPFTSGGRLRAEDTAVVCFGFQWGLEGKAKCVHAGQFKKDYQKDPFNDKKVLEKAAEAILEADFVVAHYGSGFDKPMLRTRFILNGFDEAATKLQSMKLIDTCIMARKLLRLRSSSLRYLLEIFKLGEKDPMSSADWTGVMRSRMDSIVKMAKYCAKDVAGLAKVYEKLRGYDHKHPNMNFEKKEACPTCCSTWLVKPKTPWLQGKFKYQRVHCRKCGADFKGPRL